MHIKRSISILPPAEITREKLPTSKCMKSVVLNHSSTTLMCGNRWEQSVKCLLEFAEASGLSFLCFLLGQAFFLIGFGLLFLLFNGCLNGAKLEKLLPLVSVLFVSLPPLLLKWEKRRETVNLEMKSTVCAVKVI